MNEALKKLCSSLPQPRMTRLRNLKLYEWMNHNASGKKVLNLGSGVGAFDKYLSQGIKPINLDINPLKPGLHVLGDAHLLPFRDGSIDIVYSIAVLEHTRKPWLVAEEITRVLRPGGYVVLELPFLNVIHDEHDYFRFTDKGIRSLFDKENYEVVLEQCGSGGGSFLSMFMLDYLRQFVPSRYLKYAWNIVMRYPFSLFKYLDLAASDSSGMRITANSFSFIGRKR